jgi:hypothetical protein
VQRVGLSTGAAATTVTGIWIVHEDDDTTFERPHNNELWSCLDDDADDDLPAASSTTRPDTRLS